MTRAIKKHIGDFVAIVALVAIALGAAGYIIVNQDARPNIPLLEEKPVKLKAEFSDAQAVTPGQGQSVRVAGVQIGKIAAVELDDGRAVVTMDIQRKYASKIRRDASALLRPRTGLKDMFIDLDPGTPSEPRLEEDDRIGMANTAPDVDPDEILAALDTDTRSYLQLLINGLGKGLKNNGDDLREVFRLFEPLHRDLAEVQGAFAERRVGLARLIHNYGSLTTALGDRDEDLTRLVDASAAVFRNFAAEDENISESVRRLPSALTQTEDTLAKVNTLSPVLRRALDSLRPAVRQLDETNSQVLPFAREAEPILRTEIRPFVRIAQPVVRDLRPAAVGLRRATPDLTTSVHELNRFFNMAAYNPGGTNPEGDRDTHLYWLAWAAQNAVSLHSTSDAAGPIRRFIFSAGCNTFRELAGQAAVSLGTVDPRAAGPVASSVLALLGSPLCAEEREGASADSGRGGAKEAAPQAGKPGDRSDTPPGDGDGPGDGPTVPSLPDPTGGSGLPVPGPDPGSVP